MEDNIQRDIEKALAESGVCEKFITFDDFEAIHGEALGQLLSPCKVPMPWSVAAGRMALDNA